MRARLLRLAGCLLPLVFTACADLPTTPPAVPAADPLADCYWRDDGTAVCSPKSPNWECDPWEDLDWCEDGGGECMTSAGASESTVQECPPGGGGGGGGGTTPPPGDVPTDPDTCNTGDPVVDSPGVELGFAGLWAASNPDEEMEFRHERGGWIVPDGTGGYNIQPFTVMSSNACEILVDLGSRPANAVAFVHTHPYESGVPMRVCEGIMVAGRMVYETYTNEPSDYDGRAAGIVGLPGYIIDYDKITKYVHDPNAHWKYQIVDQNGRCGY